MDIKRTKGQKLVKGMMQNWQDDVGEIATEKDLVGRLLHMDDEEFDTYIIEKEYTKRQVLMDEVIEKEKENEKKHPKTRNFYTKIGH
ncbi:MAG: hypothetical protein ACR2F1_07925 [Nitrososphaeraceae archaeon]